MPLAIGLSHQMITQYELITLLDIAGALLLSGGIVLLLGPRYVAMVFFAGFAAAYTIRDLLAWYPFGAAAHSALSILFLFTTRRCWHDYIYIRDLRRRNQQRRADRSTLQETFR